MLLNNIGIGTYAENGDDVEFVFSAGVTMADVVSIDSEKLSVTNNGEQEKSWMGYVLTCTHTDGEYVHGVFSRKLDDSTRQAIEALESNYITVKNMSENTQSQIDAIASAFETKEQ